VAAVVEAGRVLEVGVLQAHLPGLVVHLADELLDASAAEVLGEGVDRVGAGGDEGGLQKLPDAHGVVGVEARGAVEAPGVGGGVLGDGHLPIELCPVFERHEGDHDLGGRGNGDLPVRVLAGQVESRLPVDQGPGLCVEVWGPGWVGGVVLLGPGPVWGGEDQQSQR